MPNKADTTHQYSLNSTFNSMLHEILKQFRVQGTSLRIKAEINLKKYPVLVKNEKFWTKIFETSLITFLIGLKM